MADSKDMADFLKKEKLRMEKTLNTLSNEDTKNNYSEIIQSIDTALKKRLTRTNFYV